MSSFFNALLHRANTLHDCCASVQLLITRHQNVANFDVTCDVTEQAHVYGKTKPICYSAWLY